MTLWKLGAGGGSGFKVVGTQATGARASADKVTVPTDFVSSNYFKLKFPREGILT